MSYRTSPAAAAAIVPQASAPVEIAEQVFLSGDLSKLNPAERVAYYRKVCDSLRLNPFTKPFEYISLSGKLTLYATRACADQLRQIHGVSLTITGRETISGVYVVTVRAADKSGRTDESAGAVPIEGLKGEALANALMKAETKGKRRATLSICGLGWTDEAEIETIPTATPVTVDPETGEIAENPSAKSPRVLNGSETLRFRLAHLMDKAYGLRKGDPETRHLRVALYRKWADNSEVTGMRDLTDEQVLHLTDYLVTEDGREKVKRFLARRETDPFSPDADEQPPKAAEAAEAAEVPN